jgi:hypothetical protein
MIETQLDLLAPRTGRQRKEKALDQAEAEKQAAIAWLRKECANLYQQRVRGMPSFPEKWWVCADDARRLYEGSRFPAAYAANRHFFGAIFRGSQWQKVGWTDSKHPSNNGRDIKTWRYVG